MQEQLLSQRLLYLTESETFFYARIMARRESKRPWTDPVSESKHGLLEQEQTEAEALYKSSLSGSYGEYCEIVERYTS